MCIEYMIQYRFSLLELLKKQFSLVIFPLYIDNKLNWLIYRRAHESIYAVQYTLDQSILS